MRLPNILRYVTVTQKVTALQELISSTVIYYIAIVCLHLVARVPYFREIDL